MYTGLIEKVGIFKSIVNCSKMLKINIEVDQIWPDIELGESIAVNGVCLTVTDFDKKSFYADISEITAKDTTFTMLKVNTKLNLERCMKIGDRFGGHIVQGHVDGTGKVISIENKGGNLFIKISPDKAIQEMIINKASIAVNGVSLTVQEVDIKSFTLLVIPHSAANTNLIDLKVGSKVNLETDVLAKYVKHFTADNKNNSFKNNIYNSF